MSEGFHVDLYALRQAAEGINRTVDDVAHPVAAPSGGVLGHRDLTDAVDEFTARWRIGIEGLTQDGRETAGRLAQAAAAYERSDLDGARTVDGILAAPSGPDPGGG